MDKKQIIAAKNKSKAAYGLITDMHYNNEARTDSSFQAVRLLLNDVFAFLVESEKKS